MTFLAREKYKTLQFNISTKFLYEDGHGNVVDENSGPEPLDYIADQEEFIVETIATHTNYLKIQPLTSLLLITQCW